MTPAIEALEKAGLFEVESSLSRLENLPDAEVKQIVQDLSAGIDAESNARTLQDECSSPIDFNFLASPSVRGDSGCAAIACRLSKLTGLARYAALYSDRVVIPIPSICPHCSDSRNYLFRVVPLLIELRPLIEEHYVKLWTPHYCQKCIESNAEVSKIKEHASECLAKRSKDFSVSVVFAPLGSQAATIQLAGPQDYVEHGLLITRYSKAGWLPKRFRTIKRPKKPLSVPDGSPAKAWILRRLFDQITNDLVFQQMLGVGTDLKYLVGRKGESELLSASPEPYPPSQLKSLADSLAHSIPLFADLPLRTILKIRKHEPESFLAYRLALNKVLKEYLSKGGEVSKSNVIDLYQDVIAPQLHKLQKQETLHHRSLAKKALINVGVPGAVLTMGILGGALPAQVADLLKVGGALGLITEGIKCLAQSIDTSNDDVQLDSYYFLLKLSNAHK